MKLSLPITQKEGLGNWYANLLRIDRRKCVLFTHEQTLYSLFVPSLKKPEFQRLDDIFVRVLFKQLQAEMFTQGQIENILDEYDGKIKYAKTENRSLLGSMNDLAFHIKSEVQFYQTLANVDVFSLIRKLNHIPFKAIGFEHPETLFRLRVEQYTH
jgi:hypothetical protein